MNNLHKQKSKMLIVVAAMVVMIYICYKVLAFENQNKWSSCPCGIGCWKKTDEVEPLVAVTELLQSLQWS